MSLFTSFLPVFLTFTLIYFCGWISFTDRCCRAYHYILLVVLIYNWLWNLYFWCGLFVLLLVNIFILTRVENFDLGIDILNLVKYLTMYWGPTCSTVLLCFGLFTKSWSLFDSGGSLCFSCLPYTYNSSLGTSLGELTSTSFNIIILRMMKAYYYSNIAVGFIPLYNIFWRVGLTLWSVVSILRRPVTILNLYILLTILIRVWSLIAITNLLWTIECVTFDF